ncbi:heat shock protein HtpX [Actinobacillus pleuropneumoniae]|nr:heat shock protein HtpX [Actinobacillus pleuropneumoniae]
MAKRIVLFLLTNLAITFVLGIVLNIIFQVTGIQGGSTGGILVMSLVFGLPVL